MKTLLYLSIIIGMYLFYYICKRRLDINLEIKIKELELKELRLKERENESLELIAQHLVKLKDLEKEEGGIS